MPTSVLTEKELAASGWLSDGFAPDRAIIQGFAYQGRDAA